MPPPPSAGRDHRRGPRIPWRVIAVAAAAVVVVAGAAARTGTPIHLGRPPVPPKDVLTVAFLVVEILAVLFVIWLVLGIRRRKKPEDEPEDEPPPISRLSRIIATVIALLAIALPVLFLILARSRTAPQRPHQLMPGVRPTLAPLRPGARPTSGEEGLRIWIIALVIVAALIAIGVAIALIRRHMLRRAQIPRTEPDVTAAAADAGRAALATSNDPRDAVIACYEAMERVLADAGVSRAPAQTPEQLLRAAAAEGVLVSGEDAGLLVELFGRARFSTRPVTDEDVATARRALSGLAPRMAGAG